MWKENGNSLFLCENDLNLIQRHRSLNFHHFAYSLYSGQLNAHKSM